MRAALIALLAAGPVAAQGLPEPLVCVLTELTCATACPAVALILPRGDGPVLVKDLPGGDLTLIVGPMDAEVPPTFRLEGPGARGLVGLHKDGSATLALTVGGQTSAFEGPCTPQP